MIYNDVQRTSIFLSGEDREAIRLVKERYGVSTDSDAIRLALRVLSQAKKIALSPLPPERENGPDMDCPAEHTATGTNRSETIDHDRDIK